MVIWNRQHPQPDGTGLQTYDRQMVNARKTATGVECRIGKIRAERESRNRCFDAHCGGL